VSYALGQVTGGKITAGSLAKADPFMSKASLMASNVMKAMVSIPRPQRTEWLRRKLNGLWPFMGDQVISNITKISDAGKSRDQAIFDAIRLALANRLVTWAGDKAESRGISGLGYLGDFASDARTFACTSASMGATVGGFVGAFRDGADTSIIGGATAGAGIANCNLETLRLQAEIAAAQANAAAAAAAGGQSRTVLYAGLGIAGLIGLVVAVKTLK
jgi:uncharacterized membrane protein (UPF0136 family)